MTPAAALAVARRLVVKIGSALLVAERGEIRGAWLAALADDVARCRARGQEVILVSSGAIAVGRRHLGLAGHRLRLEEKQAAAATGQIRLARPRGVGVVAPEADRRCRSRRPAQRRQIDPPSSGLARPA